MEDNYKQRGLRKKLIAEIRSKGIHDNRILNAFEAVPRHHFFPPEFLHHAYQDKAFPIGEGQTISQPYTVAFQTMLLCPKPKQKILEIGTGSGYQCCILKALDMEVFSIEYNRKLYQSAKAQLKKMGCHAHLYCGDGSLGLEQRAPYDAIIVTAGAPTIPKALVAQLKIGGRLVIPVGDRHTQHMMRITKKERTKLINEQFNSFKFVPLVGQDGWNDLKSGKT